MRSDVEILESAYEDCLKQCFSVLVDGIIIESNAPAAERFNADGAAERFAAGCRWCREALEVAKRTVSTMDMPPCK